MSNNRNQTELERLITQQAADDARRSLRPEVRRGVRVIREADLAPKDQDRADLGKADLNRHRDRGRSPSKYRGRARRVAIRSDSGQWVDTEASGSRAPVWVLIEGCAPWEAIVQAAVNEEQCVCPACRDQVATPPRPGQAPRLGHYCLYCDRCGLDPLVEQGKAQLYGVKPDTVLNPCAEDYDREKREAQRKIKEQQLARRKIRGGLG